MNMTTADLERLLTSSHLDISELHDLDNACKIANPHFETLMEIFFLKTIREKDERKILNIADNLGKLQSGHDVSQTFYNIILSTFFKGADDKFIYETFEKNGARKHIANGLTKLPISDVIKVFKRLEEKRYIYLYLLYVDVLGDNSFIPTDKFTQLFDQCDMRLKQNITTSAINGGNFRVCSAINSFFLNNPYSFSVFQLDINYDYHYLIRAIANSPLYTLQHTLSEFKTFIYQKHYYFPMTIEGLLNKALAENNQSFVIDMAACNAVSKRKVMGILFDQNKNDFAKTFLEAFRDDPELEQFLAFS